MNSITQQPNTPAINVDAVRTRINRTLCEKINAVNTLHQQSLSGYKSNLQLLERGIYYPPEYYFALKEKNQTARLNAFIKKEYFHQGYLSTKHFTITKTSSSTVEDFTSIGDFIIKKNVQPSDAIQNIFEGLCLMGCGQVIQAIEYAALLEVLGTEKFNALFSADGIDPLLISIADKQMEICPLNRLWIQILKQKPQPGEIQQGDVVYFDNHEYYDVKHLGGTARGYYTICINDEPAGKKFAALGLPPEGLTDEGIKKDLLNEFNRDPHSLEFLPERMRRCFEMLASHIPNVESLHIHKASMEEFQANGGGKTLHMHRLDIEKITLLANSSLENCLKFFSSC